MMLAVLERSHEIAIRRVEGARRWHIALQFVVETGTVCAVGGILGVPMGLLLAMLRCWLEPLETIAWAFPPREATVVLVVVSAVGLIAGLLPALRALRVDPVEVLRNG
jgi:ABC-type antimicrobial peptide transport system permease subunit